MPTLQSSSEATQAGEHDPLAGYRFWFYAAALYNLLWGSLTILFPQLFFHRWLVGRPVKNGCKLILRF